MKPRQHRTSGIILSRTNFGEADRILTFITPDRGKVKLIAKAVRRSNSKLAGGIELFSISDIGYVIGRGDIGTLTSSRLIKHFGNIVKDIDRTNAAYEFIKLLDRATADNTDQEYYDLLATAMESLDEPKIDLNIIKCWFSGQLLRLSGHMPNLSSDTSGTQLSADKTYDFKVDEMAFISPKGRKGALSSDHIKFLRLIFGGNEPSILQRVNGSAQLAAILLPAIQAMLQSYPH